MAHSQQFTNRIRFNWGYHDGAADQRRGVRQWVEPGSHFDEVYRVGYLAGWGAANRGESTADSTEAWQHARAFEDVPA